MVLCLYIFGVIKVRYVFLTTRFPFRLFYPEIRCLYTCSQNGGFLWKSNDQKQFQIFFRMLCRISVDVAMISMSIHWDLGNILSRIVGWLCGLWGADSFYRERRKMKRWIRLRCFKRFISPIPWIAPMCIAGRKWIRWWISDILVLYTNSYASLNKLTRTFKNKSLSAKTIKNYIDYLIDLFFISKAVSYPSYGKHHLQRTQVWSEATMLM